MALMHRAAMYAVTCRESDERNDEVYIGYASGRLLTMTGDNTRRPVTYCNQQHILSSRWKRSDV